MKDRVFLHARASVASCALRLNAYASLAALALAASLSGAALADTHPHIRDGWFIGLGVGGGSAALTVDGESTDREGGGAGSLRAGYVFNPKLGVGFESNMWLKSQNNTDFTLTTYTAALSYFPVEGLILRAGIGGGDASVDQQAGSTTISATESGFGATAGAAYEFRLGRSFAVGPQIDFAYVNLDSFDANYFNAGISFNWYFIPR